ncbi:helix-turn-helix domain-containing protein [Streptomyces triculaminicus]|uniref:Helix-turn-helix domain-containing protein n=1 Tax=Streptomyces triculaminicus TaxID=2816232 RepID=A0A939FPR4_9ACTN|nr:helix-turn-helix transcriptional regulator [Streptomyces triculaminicus]MBO0655142.1 helix-turn-helix domain-containing protein [Streptomyces triculaminicus]
MPLRTAPTARQRRLGVELRRMREQAGMTAPQVAEQLGGNRTGITNMEAGRFGVSVERIRALARIYACGDQPYIDALASLAEERGRGWWDDYRDIVIKAAVDVAEMEHHALGLRSMTIMHMPGLLQTEDYAKAVFAAGIPKSTPTELRRNVSFRMRRRAVLDRDNPPTCTFLVHEAALRMQFGGPEVAARQLRHVLEESERENITVRAIPFAAGGFSMAGLSVLYATGPVPQLDTVQLDVAHGGALLDAQAHLANYRARLDYAEEISLGPDDTRKLMRDIAQQW